MTQLEALIHAVEHGLLQDATDTDLPSAVETWHAAITREWLAELAASRQLDEEPGETPQTATAIARAARQRRRALASSTDIATLAAITCGGTLLERRAAVRRLRTLAAEQPSALDGADIVRVEHEPELGRDLLLLETELRGSTAREARQALDEVVGELAALEQRTSRAILGIDPDSPLEELGADARARLMLHLPDASSLLVAFVMERCSDLVKQGSDAEASDALASFRVSADPRTVPLLVAILLDDPRSELRAEAARCLGRVDDARAVPALAMAQARASEMHERLAIAEAFGIAGCSLDADLIRQGLASAQVGVQLMALDALYDADIAELAVPLTKHPSMELKRAAVRAMGRAGDARALTWLDQLERGNTATPPAVQFEIAMARQAIVARAELRGETSAGLLDHARRMARRRALIKPLARNLGAAPTKRHRFAAFVLLLRARIVEFFNAHHTASMLAERANQADPEWLMPPLFLGRLWHRSRQASRAVAAFRQALAIAPSELAANPGDITEIATAYVTLTEQLLKQGHPDRARALLDELMGYDLTRAASHVRLALRRYRRQLAVSRASLVEAAEVDAAEVDA